MLHQCTLTELCRLPPVRRVGSRSGGYTQSASLIGAGVIDLLLVVQA